MKKAELARKLAAAEARIARMEFEIQELRQRGPAVWPSGPIWIDPNYRGWPLPLRVTCGTTTMTAPKGVTITHNEQVDSMFKDVALMVERSV